MKLNQLFTATVLQISQTSQCTNTDYVFLDTYSVYSLDRQKCRLKHSKPSLVDLKNTQLKFHVHRNYLAFFSEQIEQPH